MVEPARGDIDKLYETSVNHMKSGIYEEIGEIFLRPISISPSLPKETSIYWIPKACIQTVREQAPLMPLTTKLPGTLVSEAVYSTIIASAGQSSAA